MQALLMLDPEPEVKTDTLNLDVEHILQLPAEAFIGQRIAVLGAPGFGKGNTIAVLFEELADKLPFTIFDPHGEYYGLKEKFDILIVGKGEVIDIEMGVEQAEAIARFAYENQIHVIVNMLEMDDDERLEFTYLYCKTLWDLNLRVKRTIGVVLDESHIFIPETKANIPSLKMMSKFALEGRKFGFTIMVSDQRTANISKNVLNACDVAFMHGVNGYADVQAYQGMLPYSLAETKKIALELNTGEALVKLRFQNHRFLESVQMRKRHTFHASDTPTVNGDPSNKFQPRPLDMTLIAELKSSMTSKPSPKAEKPNLDNLPELLEHNAKRFKEAESKYEHWHKVEQFRLYWLAMTYRVTTKRQQQQIQLLESAASRAKNAPVEPSVEHQPALIEGHEPTDDYRSPRSISRAINKQAAQFQAMLRDLQKLPRFQQTMLVYLANYEGQELELKQIARFIGIATKTIYDRPPMELMTRKLINRRTTGRGGGQYYKATIREMLKASYPDLDQDELFMKVTAIQRLT